MSQTLVLTRAKLRRAMDVPVPAGELRNAFERYGEDRQAQQVRAGVTSAVTATVLVPGTAAGVPAYTVKVHTKNSGRHLALTGASASTSSRTDRMLS